MILRELFVYLGANTDKATVDAFKKSMDDAKGAATALVKTMGVVTAAAGGVAMGLWKLTRQTADVADAAAKGAAQLGITTEAYQELQFAAEDSGSSAGDIERALRRLARSADDAAKGGSGSAQMFRRLGVSFEDANKGLRSADDLFMDVADRIAKTTNETEKLAIAQDVFGRSGQALLPLLKQGRDGIAAVREEARAGVISSEAAAEFEEFNNSIYRIRFQLSSFRNQLVAGVFPTINSLVTRFQHWLQANRELINSKIEEWTERLTKLWNIAEREARRLNKTVEQFGGWENLFKVLGAAVAGIGIVRLASTVSTLGIALKGLFVTLGAAIGKAGLGGLAIALAKPIAIGLAIIAVVAGIALVVDDLLTFLRGGESVIGNFFERFGAVEQLKGVFASIGAAVQQFGRLALVWARLVVRSWILQFKLIWAVAGPVIKLLVAAIVGFWKNVTWPVIQWLAEAFAWVFGGIADGLEWVEENWEHFGAAIKMMASDAAQWFRDQWEKVLGWITGMLDKVLERFAQVRDRISNLPGMGVAGRFINRARGAFAPSDSRNPRSPAASSTTQNASTQVNVHVEGSNANPAEIGRQVARGAEDGMGRALRQTQAATAGGEM